MFNKQLQPTGFRFNVLLIAQANRVEALKVRIGLRSIHIEKAARMEPIQLIAIEQGGFENACNAQRTLADFRPATAAAGLHGAGVLNFEGQIGG